MLKKTLFAFIAAALVGAIALPPESAFAGQGGRSCREAAKARFPDDVKARHAFKKECKAAWKAHKSAPKA